MSMIEVSFRIALFIALSGTLLAAEDSGLLLGLRGVKGFRTLWLVSANEKASIRAQFKDVLVPRKTGFWKVQEVTTCEDGGDFDWMGQKATFYTEESKLIVRPIEVIYRPKLKAKVRLGNCRQEVVCISNWMDLTFVSPEYISFEAHDAVECGAHPDGSSVLVTSRLSTALAGGVSIQAAFGPDAPEVFEKAMQAGEEQVTKAGGEPCGVRASVEKSSWAIHRKAGRWVPTGWTETHRLCGYGFDFPIPLQVPPFIARSERLPLSWDELRKQVPRASDAFASPDGRFVVVIAGGRVRGFAFDGKALKDTGIGAELERSASDNACEASPKGRSYCERIVMAEWASGANVARWTRQIEDYLKRGFLQPSPPQAAPARRAREVQAQPQERL